MARRKRLTPPNPDYLSDAAPLETKSALAGPMARAPIADVAREASASAALDEMAQTLTRARDEGRMVVRLPLGAVQTDHLVRDRIAADDAEMDVLMASLRARGQQVPVEVEKLGEGRYGLISGWRRCQALARLHAETGEARFGEVAALLRRPGEASEAYLAMVEENEIRVGLSYFERARIVAKSVEQGVFETEKHALQTLFHAASRAKRSKIGSFLAVVRELDGVLRWPEALSERAGLDLARRLEDDPELGARLRLRLMQGKPGDAAAEGALLQDGQMSEEKTLKAGSETEKAPRAASEKPQKLALRPGLEAQLQPDGSVTLRGSALSGELRQRLLDWLARTPL